MAIIGGKEEKPVSWARLIAVTVGLLAGLGAVCFMVWYFYSVVVGA